MKRIIGGNNQSIGPNIPLRASEVLLLAAVFSLGFMQPHLIVYGFAMQATEPVFLALTAAMAAAVLLGSLRSRFDRYYLVLGLYFAALLLSAFFSQAAERSFPKLIGEAYLIGLAVAAGLLVRGPEMFRRIFLVWIAASSVVAIIGLITVVIFYVDRSSLWLDWFLHHYGSLPPGNYPRIQSTFMYPAMLCNYLTVSLAMLFAALRSEWMRGWLAYLLMGIHIIAAVFTVTPGLGGLVFAAAVWMAILAQAYEKPLASQTCLVVGVLAVIGFLAVSLFTLRPIETAPYSFDILGTRVFPTQRLLAWQDAATTALEHPVFGKGLGLGVAGVDFLPPSGERQFLTDAHNTWLNVAGQAGVIGLLAIILLSVMPIRLVWPLQIGSDAMSVICAALGLAFISSFIVQGMVGSFENARHLWVLIGLILAAANRTE